MGNDKIGKIVRRKKRGKIIILKNEKRMMIKGSSETRKLKYSSPDHANEQNKE